MAEPAEGALAYDNAAMFVDSFWNEPLAADAELSQHSALWTRNLCFQMRVDPDAVGIYPTVVQPNTPNPWFNLSYSNYKVYVVDDTVPLVNVAVRWVLIGGGGQGSWSPTLHAALMEGVPIPDGAAPEGTSDHSMVVYNPTAKKCWEFISFYPLGAPQVAGFEGPTPGTHEGETWEYSVSAGGRLIDIDESPGYYRNVVSGGTIIEQGSWGSTATSIPLIAGLITPAEMDAVRNETAEDFGHVLKCAVGDASTRTQWPAQRNDGTHPDNSWLPEGARFRLPASVDMADYAGETVMVRAFIKTLRDYGMIPADKTGNSPDAPNFRSSASYNTEPYVTSDFGEPNLWDPDISVLWKVPWHKCQVVSPTVSGGPAPPIDPDVPPAVNVTVDLTNYSATQGNTLVAGSTVTSTLGNLEVVATLNQGVALFFTGTFTAGQPYRVTLHMKGDAGGEQIRGFFGAFAIGEWSITDVQLTTGFADYEFIWTPSVNRTGVGLALRRSAATGGPPYTFDIQVINPPTAYSDVILGTAGLVGYWRLGESSGTSAEPQAGLAGPPDPGTYGAGVTLGAPSAIVNDGDTAVYLDGFGTGNIAFQNPTLVSPFSLESWHNCMGPGDVPGNEEFGTLFGKPGAPVRRILHNTVDECMLVQMGGADMATANDTAPLFTKLHIVYTYDGTTEKLYINGVERASQATASGPTWNTDWYVGSSETVSTHYPLKGHVDEIAIYNAALSPETVLEHRLAGSGLTYIESGTFKSQAKLMGARTGQAPMATGPRGVSFGVHTNSVVLEG